MKQFIFPSVLMACGIALITYGCLQIKPQHEVKKVIYSNTDERGLTSVVFTVNDKDTFGFDFLNKAEYDSIFNNQ